MFYRSPSQENATQAVQRQVVAMEPTLGQALADIFGQSTPVTSTPSPSASGQPGATPSPAASGQPGTTATLAQLIQRANQEFAAAQQAQQTGNWAEYGRQLKALQQTLAQLQAVK